MEYVTKYMLIGIKNYEVTAVSFARRPQAPPGGGRRLVGCGPCWSGPVGASFESSRSTTRTVKPSRNQSLEKLFGFRQQSSLMNFEVVLQEAEEGGYIVSCPALPGCHSQGDNVEVALKNIKEAIAGCLKSLA